MVQIGLDNMEDHTDAIRSGMEKWESTRKAAMEAIDRCKVAEDKSARLEAQNELLVGQDKQLREENVRLRSMVEDAKVGLAAAMSALLAAKDNLNTGVYRQNGSTQSGSTRAREDSVAAVEEAMKQFAQDDGKRIPAFLNSGPAVKP